MSYRPEASSQKRFCHACAAEIDGRAAICPKCGVPQSNTARQGHPNAALGLILNIFFPGVGTIVLGQVGTGIVQLILGGIGFLLSFVLIGIPLLVGVWIWAVVIGAQAFSPRPSVS